MLIHSPFYWRILHKTPPLLWFLKSYKKSIYEWNLVERLNEGKKPNKYSRLSRLEFMPRNLNQKSRLRIASPDVSVFLLLDFMVQYMSSVIYFISLLTNLNAHGIQRIWRFLNRHYLVFSTTGRVQTPTSGSGLREPLTTQTSWRLPFSLTHSRYYIFGPMSLLTRLQNVQYIRVIVKIFILQAYIVNVLKIVFPVHSRDVTN